MVVMKMVEVHEFQDRFGGVVPSDFLFGLHAPEVCRFLIDRRRHQTDGCAGGIVETHVHVEPSPAFEQGGQIDGGKSFGIEVNRPGLVAINAVGTRIKVSLDLVEDKIATVAQHEITRTDWKRRCGGLVVFAVGVDGEADQTGAEQVVGGLNPRITNARLSVGDAGKLREEMAGELNDGAVPDQQPLVAAELIGGSLWRGIAAGELLANDILQKALEEYLEGLVEAEVDGLAGRSAALAGFDTCG